MSSFRKFYKFAIFYSAVVLLDAITAIIPDKDGNDVYSKINDLIIYMVCRGWLRKINALRFRARTKHYYDSLNSLICDIFAAVAVCITALPSWTIKGQRLLCAYIFAIKTSKSRFASGAVNQKSLFHSSQKYSEIHT